MELSNNKSRLLCGLLKSAVKDGSVNLPEGVRDLYCSEYGATEIRFFLGAESYSFPLDGIVGEKVKSVNYNLITQKVSEIVSEKLALENRRHEEKKSALMFSIRALIFEGEDFLPVKNIRRVEIVKGGEGGEKICEYTHVPPSIIPVDGRGNIRREFFRPSFGERRLPKGGRSFSRKGCFDALHGC